MANAGARDTGRSSPAARAVHRVARTAHARFVHAANRRHVGGRGLDPFVEAGKAVFGVEYKLETHQFCPDANAPNSRAKWSRCDSRVSPAAPGSGRPMVMARVFAWNAASNNQGINSGELSYILNSISAYRTAQDEGLEVADDIWFTPALEGPETGVVASHVMYNWIVPDRVLAGRSDIPEWKQASGILFYVNERRSTIEMEDTAPISLGRAALTTESVGGDTIRALPSP